MGGGSSVNVLNVSMPSPNGQNFSFLDPNFSVLASNVLLSGLNSPNVIELAPNVSNVSLFDQNIHNVRVFGPMLVLVY